MKVAKVCPAAARDHSLSVEENSNTTLLLCALVTRTFEPRQSRLYGVGGSSAFGNICADAIVKSSTSLRNSVSLNSRMLAYAATTRSARTRALRSCVILTSAIVHRPPCDRPSVPGTELKSQPNITPDGCAAPTTHGFLNFVSSQETKAARNSHLPKDAAQIRNLQSTEILAKRMFQSFQNWQTFRFVRASAWSPGSLRDIQQFILKSKESRSRPIPQIPRASVTLIEEPLATQHGRFSGVRKPPTPPSAAICRRSESRSKWQCGSHVLAAARGMGREIPDDQRA
jgi:hypothetical protein